MYIPFCGEILEKLLDRQKCIKIKIRYCRTPVLMHDSFDILKQIYLRNKALQLDNC